MRNKTLRTFAASRRPLIIEGHGVVPSAFGSRVYVVALRRRRVGLEVTGSTLVTRDVERTVRVAGGSLRSCGGAIKFRGGRRRSAVVRGDGSEWPRRGRVGGEMRSMNDLRIYYRDFP